MNAPEHSPGSLCTWASFVHTGAEQEIRKVRRLTGPSGFSAPSAGLRGEKLLDTRMRCEWFILWVTVQDAMASGLPVALLWDSGYAGSVDRNALVAVDSLEDRGQSAARLAVTPELRQELGHRS